MKKIILAIDGDNFSEGAFEFARKMNEQEPVLLTGVFLPELDIAQNVNYTSVFIPVLADYGAGSIERSLEKFKENCLRYDINYTVHNNKHDFALAELRKETRFADLVVLGSEKFYGDLTVYGPREFLGGALHNTECPVVVVPEKFNFPESVILAYDGSAASAFAIKSFTYLFPQLCNRHTILVYSSVKEDDIPELQKIKELATIHFPNLSFQLLGADPKKYFSTWLEEIKNPIVVGGAYGRSAISRLFKHSFMAEIMHTHQVPVYIAHL